MCSGVSELCVLDARDGRNFVPGLIASIERPPGGRSRGSAASMMKSAYHRACDSCRIRKAKCSGEKEGCSRCRSFSQHCVYSAKKTLGRPRKQGAAQAVRRYEPSSIAESSESSFSTPPLTECADYPGNSIMSGWSDQFTNAGLGAPPSMDDRSTPSHQDHGHETRVSLEPRIALDRTSERLQSAGKPSEAQQARTQCSCYSRGHSIIADLAQDRGAFYAVNKSREALQIAGALLSCEYCYNLESLPSRACQNVLLVGHLLSSIAFSCSTAWHLVRPTTSDSTPVHLPRCTLVHEDSTTSPPQSMLLTDSECTEIIQLCIRRTAGDLQQLCDGFETRQFRRHRLGHELCSLTSICVSGRASKDHVLDGCSAQKEMKKQFPCFKSVEQVRSAVDALYQTMEDPDTVQY
ncbi:hypothetical protein ABEF93_006183 [Exophiala dermatitidis]